MLLLVLSLILTAVATEATIKVLLSSKVFETPREFIFSKISEASLVGKLIRCPYCLSFWFSGILLLLMWLFPTVWLVYCCWLTVQRGSNVVDDITDKIYYGQYGPGGLSFDNKDENS